MKRIIKGLLIVICLGFINVRAWEKEYRDLNPKTEVKVEGDNFILKNLKLEDYTDYFGLIGEIENNTGNSSIMNIKVSFYDNSGALVADVSQERTINQGNSHLNLVFDSSVLKGKSASSIAKYNIVLNVQKDNTEINKDLYASTNSKYSHYDYVMDSYNVDVVIDKNNVYSVNEMITIHFNKAVDSFTREIPLEGFTISDYKIDGVDAIIEEGDIFKVKVEPNSKAGDEKIYNITYKMIMDKEHKDIDYNILPNWNTAIGSFNCSVKLPKETHLDDALLLVEGKVRRSTNNKDLIMGSADEILDSKTVRLKLDLPDDYFGGNKKGSSSITNITNNIWIPIVAVVVIVAIVVAVVLIKKKPKKKMETL